ncbi:MAG: N-acetylmuramoyl-L-alanine amidase [Bacteroidales bacterium]|nr:N-acetylmuramoyl-L-alanine amidase [Bacteroidales bacterium]
MEGVLQEADVPLKERASRINARCAALGKENVILVSIHANAAGNGSKWLNATCWSVYTSKGQTKADLLADDLARAAMKYLGSKAVRGDFADGDIDYEEGFYILKHTISPAVLTENLFFTNEDDLAFLEPKEGKQAIVDLHVEGIIDYLSR